MVRRGLDRAALERDPAEVLSTPSMVPLYMAFRPSSVLCIVLAGMIFTFGAGVAYDSLFWTSGSRNVLLYTTASGAQTSPSDGTPVDHAGPIGGELTFGGLHEPMSPFQRWLRVSLVVYVKLPEGCDDSPEDEATPNAKGLRPEARPRAALHRCAKNVARNVLVSSELLARDFDGDEWKSLANARDDPQRVECIDHADSNHPGWPADGDDPLQLGRRAHCYVLSLAFTEGLHYQQYKAKVSISSEPGYAPLDSWVQNFVFVQTSGTVDHGYAEMGLRLVSLFTSIITFALYARAMHLHAFSEWLPQQFGVYFFALFIIGYNNPLYAVFMPLGKSYSVAAAIFDIAFFSSGMLLATVLADPVGENMKSLPDDYWTIRLLVTVPLFFLGVVQYALSAQHLRADPSFMYEMSGGFFELGVIEVILFSVWSLYVMTLLTFQLRLQETRMHANKKELVFAGITSLIVGTIWLRESITFKIYAKDYMSDERFKYRARTVIMCNVFAFIASLCYAPSTMSDKLASLGGGLDRMVRGLLHAGPRTASEEVSDSLSAVDALKQYVENLRKAHRDGVKSFTAEQLDTHAKLKEMLLKLPQTRAYVTQLTWVYPTLGFQSHQPYLWAIVLNDFDDPVSLAKLGVREKRRSVRFDIHENPAGLELDDTPGIVAGKEFLLELRKTGLVAGLHRAPLGAKSVGSALVVLIADCDAVYEEYVRHYGHRLMVEASLDLEVPPPNTAEKLSAISRLLTESIGDGHRPLGDVSWHTGGVELVAASYPLHDRGFNAQVDREWGLAPEISEAHLRVVRDHYGEELAWYFGLCDFTVEWLFPVAALGFMLEMIKLGGDIVFYEMLWVAFGSALAIWGAFFTAFWRRRSSELRWDWDVDSLLASERRNPYYQGEWVTDAQTGTLKSKMSTLSRLPAFLNTAFQMLLQVVVLIFIEYFSYGQFVWACEMYDTGDPKDVYMFIFQTSIVNTMIYVGGIMFGQYVIWSKVALWATKKENWPYETQLERQYVYYVFIFIWLDGYFWSWFFGYIHIPLVDMGVDLREWTFPIFGKLITHERTADYWMKKHDTMVANMLGMNQILAFLFENVWPLLLVYLARRSSSARRAATVHTYKESDSEAAVHTAATNRRKRAGFASPTATIGALGDQLSAMDKQRERREQMAVESIVSAHSSSSHSHSHMPSDEVTRATVIQALDELQLPVYSTQDDYYDVVLFIGYIVTYTIQWPLTPVVCYLNNNLELRSDLVKINNAFRRMVPRKQKNIGAWEYCINFSVWAAIPMVVTFATISNRTAEIFFLASEDPENAGHSVYWNEEGHVKWWWRILVCFAWEHMLCIICLIIYMVVNDEPKWVRQARHAVRFELAKEMHGEHVEKINSGGAIAAGLAWLSGPSEVSGEGDESARKRGRLTSLSRWIASRRRTPRFTNTKMS